MIVRKLIKLRPSFNLIFKHVHNMTESDNLNTIKIPPEPTNCCMSGCANCVWIEYAEELQKLYIDGGEKVKEMILAKVEDPNMKAFLSMELKSLDKT